MNATIQNVPDLPSNVIIIQNGQVTLIKKWIVWNSQPRTIFRMRRKGKLFEAHANQPGHPKLTKKLPLDQAVAILLHSGFCANLMDLFKLTDPTIDQIHALGFTNYYIVHS